MRVNVAIPSYFPQIILNSNLVNINSAMSVSMPQSMIQTDRIQVNILHTENFLHD